MTIEPKKISGFTELLPEERIAELSLIDAIRRTYELSGFSPIETPAVERLEVLVSKGADDREIYGLHRIHAAEGEEAELGLHFDLTVPLARYVAQYYNDLTFPFRRYQMQKVWRGERPQAGRAREFVQADVDIVAEWELPLSADVEVIAVIHSVFRSIGFADYTMRINNRKVLRGFLSFLELPESLASDTIRLIDKIDKIGISKIEQELQTLLGSEAIVSSILEYLKLRTLSNTEKLEYLAAVDHPDVRAGVAELREVYEGILALGVDESRLVIDPAIARGLDYYTGTIVETFVNGHENLGSIASGGRYEDLASNFINRKLPGVGVSIGQTRLFYVLRELGYISVGPRTPSVFFVARFEDTPSTHAFELLSRLRAAGIPAESALDPGQKIGKQIAAADKKGIAYVAMAGSDEIVKGIVQIKKLATGESREFPASGDPADWRF